MMVTFEEFSPTHDFFDYTRIVTRHSPKRALIRQSEWPAQQLWLELLEATFAPLRDLAARLLHD